MNLYEFVKCTFKKNRDFVVRPKIICADGFTMSVQGSIGHYCSPRENVEFYYAMEVGYPSLPEPLLLEFAEDQTNITKTVCGFVPIEIIEEIIMSHGGINEELTFKKIKTIKNYI